LEQAYYQDQTFDRSDWLAKGEYENCTFSNCYLSETDLSSFKFIDCVFTGCNLSMALLAGTVFRDVTFDTCKMLGLDFEKSSEYGLSFTFNHCILESASFKKAKIKRTLFNTCSLINTDFSEADLTEAIFKNCDMADAYFDNTLLQKADFTSSYNYAMDPDANKIKKAQFSAKGLEGLLRKYDLVIIKEKE
jgi:fluoroquinolone resistance protein